MLTVKWLLAQAIWEKGISPSNEYSISTEMMEFQPHADNFIATFTLNV